MNFETSLLEAAKTLKLDGIDSKKIEALLTYAELVFKWNAVYNLTASKNESDLINRHIKDSLTVAPYICGERIIDIGTGAGLPGIPLAILFPQKKFTLLDSNGKKTRFLTHAKIALNLKNVEVVQSRVENYQNTPYDCLLSRAFSSILQTLSLTAKLWNNNGLFIFMKGENYLEELQNLPMKYKTQDVAIDNSVSKGSHLILVTQQ